MRGDVRRQRLAPELLAPELLYPGRRTDPPYNIFAVWVAESAFRWGKVS